MLLLWVEKFFIRIPYTSGYEKLILTGKWQQVMCKGIKGHKGEESPLYDFEEKKGE